MRCAALVFNGQCRFVTQGCHNVIIATAKACGWVAGTVDDCYALVGALLGENEGEITNIAVCHVDVDIEIGNGHRGGHIER